MTETSEAVGEVVEKNMAENGTNGATSDTNGKEESVLEQTAAEETVVVAATKTKVLNVAPAEEVPENFDDYLSETQPGDNSEASGDNSTAAAAVPTSVIQSAPKAEEKVEEKEENLDKEEKEEEAQAEEEAPKEASCTVADLIEEEEEDKEEEEAKEEEQKEEEAVKDSQKEEEEEESEEQKEEEESEEQKEEEESKEEEMEVDDKKAEERSAKPDTKSAAELAYEWDDEGVEVEKPAKATPVKKETPKKKEKSAAVLRAEAEVTPGRKSSRTPKPTQRKLESESQKNLKDPEEDEKSEGEGEEDEESVDAIAKELEKSDSKTSPKGKGSPKKGKKPVSEEKSKEEWEKIIFGENGEKVTEKGRKPGDEKAKDKDGEEGPEAEEFLPDDTPKTKKGGRPKKKGLDETQEGVAKLGSNMYFYTGPGGSESPPPLDSDEEDLPIKKADSEPARKSSRANKGQNKRLERKDEVVDIPQVKEAPKPNLNPSWLKNHDSKNSPKKGSTPATKATPAAKTPASAKKAEPAAKKENKKEEGVVEKEEEVVEKEEVEEPMETEEEPIAETPKGKAAKKVAEDKKKEVPATPSDTELPEFDPEKFTPGYVPKTVKKGEDEYMIVVSGVKDTGLCGSYWNVGEGGRRRSKPPETLQMGKNERRGSVGSVNSEKSGKASPAPGKKTPAATPKSTKKQVTKPEKAEPEEDKTPVRGRKRKGEEAAKKEDDTKEFSDYDSSKEETTQPLRKKIKKAEADSPTKEPIVSSKQQTAVQAALAAGVPAGQQRSVSCVADTNTQKEVVVECFAPYDDHRWVNIGKERDGMAPDAVQYARALRPPYHLLSFLRIKGHSTKGMSCTDKNTMVFVVLEGEITVILHTTQFNAKKGDSFYIPPKNYYNLINQKAREAELSLIQFQYDGPLPTVQPSSS